METIEQEKKVYKKIIFEKDVFSKVSEFLKDYKRIMVITSPAPSKQYLQFLSNILKEKNITFWVHTILHDSTCTNDNILKACAKVKNADMILSLGAGTVTDITKITAKKMELPYCVIPTTISHYGLFNNIAYIMENNLPVIFKANYPEKVFLDDAIIKKSPESFIWSATCFAIALAEQSFVCQTQIATIGETPIDIFKLNAKINKIQELTNWLTLSKDFALLNLADYIIDISELCKGSYSTNSILYALSLHSSTLKNNFGEKVLFASIILLKTYESMFHCNKIIIKDLPNRDKIIKIYEKFMKNCDFFEKFLKRTQCYMSERLLNTLNANKENLSITLEKTEIFINKFSKKLLLNDSNDRVRMVDESNVYEKLSILPFLNNNFLLNILTRFGYLNVS